MGKKSKNVQKGKGEKKELQPVSRTLKINLHKQCHGVQFQKNVEKTKNKFIKIFSLSSISSFVLSLNILNINNICLFIIATFPILFRFKHWS